MESVKHPAVPKSVKNEDLQEAMEPLYRLLGISGHWVYSEPGITIGHDRVTFMTVPDRTDEEMSGNVLAGSKARPEMRHPQDDDFAELMCFVAVDVELP